MSTVPADAHVAALVLEQPGRARVFERFGIDYCCGGNTPLATACAERGVNVEEVLEALDVEPAGPEAVDWTAATVADLVAHIVERHHGYLREELPLLRLLADKVARAHGERHPELVEVQSTFATLADELEHHLAEEEQQVFPAFVAMEESATTAGTLAEPVAHMVHEHEQVAAGLILLRELTNGYEPPSDACNSYRSLFDRLRTLEQDTHSHVHKENNILFPRAA